MEYNEVLELFNNLKFHLINLNYPINSDVKLIPVFTDTAARFGTYNMQANTIELTTLCIASGFEQVKTTIIHELLHSIKKANNHGKIWKFYAGWANTDFKVSITTRSKIPQEAMSFCHDMAKYVLVCSKCGATIYRNKKGKLIKNFKFYRCECDGEFELIKGGI